MLSIQLNDKVIGHTDLGKTKRVIGFLVCSLKRDQLEFVDIFSSNKVSILCSVDLL
jgi:hypothetical protein